MHNGAEILSEVESLKFQCSAIVDVQSASSVDLLNAIQKSVFFKEVYHYILIHSGHFYSAPSSPLLLRGAPDYSTDTVSEFHSEAHRQL